MSSAPQATQLKQTQFTLDNFVAVADALPDLWLELIDGRIEIVPPPDKLPQKLTLRLMRLLYRYHDQMAALGCEANGSFCYFEVPEELRRPQGSSNVCPDASIAFTDFLDSGRRPPALLVIEVLSTSNSDHIKRDLVTKLSIYAALKIPNYWVIDRRDQSVCVFRQPQNGEYQASTVFHGEEILPADVLEFLQITPAQIFAS
ncbi:MAG: Uma2 family endonuclease [Acidobacteria bacterium]|nr:Uma2 family endonuclease [Acidobacteriota bacterium]MBI3424174.1 Uma2 family endonuclease [Acidobacteriota bacterium]